MSLFKPVYLDQRVSLSPTEFREAAANIDEFLVKKIRKGLEGQCCMHGYVRPGSTQILARSMGQAEHGRFTGDFLYHCKVKILCLLPNADQMVDARILKMNKLGGYALVVDQGRVREAMRILLPRDLHLGNTEFDGLQVGQGVRVRILRSRFQANDAFIQAVGMFEGLAPSADASAEVAAPAVEDGQDVGAEVEGEAEISLAPPIQTEGGAAAAPAPASAANIIRAAVAAATEALQKTAAAGKA
jgi:hypothetical protein